MCKNYINILGRILTCGLLLSAATTASATCSFNVNSGKVTRVYPTFSNGAGLPSGTFFTIGGLLTQAISAGGYYFIPNYDNYAQLHDTVMEAAKSQKILRIRTNNCSGAVAVANVQYLFIDFP